jgi:2-dehydro-3-deoxyglucarate aldolase/4-hydroxy-2-oxoheptanedioate aldolase
MVPMVESQEQAEALARACRYPPEGRRGAAFGFAQCDYLGGDVAEKMRDYHARTLLIAQIETERGLQNVEAIAAVDGVDVLWVGHFDLSNFMGIPGQFDHPDFLAAMKHVAQVAKKHGKIAGFMATDKAWVERAKAMGYTMMAAGTDTALLQGALGQLIVDIDLAPKA